MIARTTTFSLVLALAIAITASMTTAVLLPEQPANHGEVGPGLSELVAIAEGILRKYGITKTFADIMDLDAGILAIASGILNINGKEGIIATPGKLLGNSPPK